jgi:hypothetical protein
MRKFVAALLLASLPLTAQNVPTDEMSELQHRQAEYGAMVRYLEREQGAFSVEDICLQACKRSHGKEHNTLWRECVADARDQLIEYRSNLLSISNQVAPMDFFAYMALLNAKVKPLEEHLESYHAK